MITPRGMATRVAGAFRITRSLLPRLRPTASRCDCRRTRLAGISRHFAATGERPRQRPDISNVSCHLRHGRELRLLQHRAPNKSGGVRAALTISRHDFVFLWLMLIRRLIAYSRQPGLSPRRTTAIAGCFDMLTAHTYFEMLAACVLPMMPARHYLMPGATGV